MRLSTLFFVGLGVTGAGLALSRRETPPNDPPAPPDDPPKNDDYEVVEAFIGGATKQHTDLPLIVLLHADDSDPSEALTRLKGLDQPARVIAPLGRFPTAGGRHSWYEPQNDDAPFGLAALLKAQRAEVLRLAKWLPGVSAGAVPERAIVVGLGSAGALAVGLGLGAPFHVRQAYGTGGTWPSVDVPLSLPGLGGLSKPAVRKISFGDAVATDAAAIKLAKERGFDYERMITLAPPDEATTDKWLLPQLEAALLLP